MVMDIIGNNVTPKIFWIVCSKKNKYLADCLNFMFSDYIPLHTWHTRSHQSHQGPGVTRNQVQEEQRHRGRKIVGRITKS